MDKTEIENLHKALLTSWNKQDAKGMASLFTEDGSVIGFDGSQHNGQSEIESEMRRIFTDHQTARFIWRVLEVRFLQPGVAVLRAIAGMVPPGEKNINPKRNAIQSITAVEENTDWKIALFQNTPAQFHGRPQLAEKLTEELRQLL